MGVDLFRRRTARPVEALPPLAARRGELNHGIMLEKPLEGLAHGRLTARLARLVGNYVEAWRLGETTGADTGYLLAQNSAGPLLIYAPDVAFVSARRLALRGPREAYVPCAPDLAIEVVSTADRAPDLEARVLDYLRAETAQVWVVYPDTQTVLVHTTEYVRRLGPDSVLAGSDVLPGFAVPVAVLFGAETPLVTTRR